jgi:two-component system, NarL family, nitrate/nitrite response regulator NarL
MNLQNTPKLTGALQEILSLEQETLLNYLIEQSTQSTPLKVLQSTEETINEILVESDIDGVHYCLVRCRMPKPASVKLSPRELAIARYVAQGLPSKSIGAKLEISHWTVNTYVRRIFEKLGVTSRTAMITRLLQESLLE